MLRTQTKEVKIGSVTIGGAHPVAIQSMTKYENRRCGGNSRTDLAAGSSRM